MSTDSNLRERRRLRMQEGELIDLRLGTLFRAVVYGVSIGDRDVPRLTAYRRLCSIFAAWWRWTTALPGDRFWDIQRDLIVEVAHGVPSRRIVRLMTPEALRYPSVQSAGLDYVMRLVTPERNFHEWWQLYPWSDKRQLKGDQ